MSPFFPFSALGSECSVTWGPAPRVLPTALLLSGCVTMEKPFPSPASFPSWKVAKMALGRGRGRSLAPCEALCLGVREPQV